MKNKKIGLVENINNLSYADFVGFINQWNTPPGSYSTISKLAKFSNMDKKSVVLEVGCSTGFSLRELVLQTGAAGVGIDVSVNSIDMAKYNKEKHASGCDIKYMVKNGYEYAPSKKFTHIMVGGNLKFFGKPEDMMERCVNMLSNNGYILATPYYMIKKMPTKLINEVSKTIGIPLSAFSNFDYKGVIDMYNKLEIVYEERNLLQQETDKEIDYYCKSVISRACDIHKIKDKSVYDVMYHKLYNFRKLINATRDFQEYNILVLRYRKSIYPNRLTPLF